MSVSCECNDKSCNCSETSKNINDLKRKMFDDLDIPETPKPTDLISQAMSAPKKKKQKEIEHSIPLNYRNYLGAAYKVFEEETLIKIESKQMKSDIPEFRPGDTVVVSVRVKEGDRTRLQAFEGVVMGVKKAGLNSSFIVRKISSGIGVERTFQTHSPMIDSINVKRKGDVRQAKLFYLRERSGKSARIKERLE